MRYKAALIGFGNVAKYGHLPWYRTGSMVELIAVVEPTSSGRMSAQTLMPGVKVFSSIDELLTSQRPDFVDITAPPAAHAELILKAIYAGVNVVCEKPFVTSPAALQDVRRACLHHDVVVAACHNWRFAPAIQSVRQDVLRGSIGAPLMVRFIAKRPAPATGAAHWKPMWRESAQDGGGIIADLGYHGIYLASDIFQRRPLSVIASVVVRNGVDMAARLIIDYGVGRAEMKLSWLAENRMTVFEIVGAQGAAVVDDSALRTALHGSSIADHKEVAVHSDSWHPDWTAAVLDSYVDLLDHPDIALNWRDIEWTVSTVAAAYASAIRGIEVSSQS